MSEYAWTTTDEDFARREDCERVRWLVFEAEWARYKAVTHDKTDLRNKEYETPLSDQEIWIFGPRTNIMSKAEGLRLQAADHIIKGSKLIELGQISLDTGVELLRLSTEEIRKHEPYNSPATTWPRR